MLTNKAFYEMVLNANLSDEMNEKAKHLLEITNAKAESSTAKSKALKAENLTLLNKILETLDTEKVYSVSEIAPNFPELTKPKISALMKLGVDENLLTLDKEYKVGGKGRKVNGYKKI